MIYAPPTSVGALIMTHRHSPVAKNGTLHCYRPTLPYKAYLLAVLVVGALLMNTTVATSISPSSTVPDVTVFPSSSMMLDDGGDMLSSFIDFTSDFSSESIFLSPTPSQVSPLLTSSGSVVPSSEDLVPTPPPVTEPPTDNVTTTDDVTTTDNGTTTDDVTTTDVVTTTTTTDVSMFTTTVTDGTTTESTSPTTTTTTTTTRPTTVSPVTSFNIAVVAGAAAGGGILLLIVLFFLCCCCYCCFCRSSSKNEYATGNEGRPWVVVRTYTQNVERHGSVISRGSRGSFARSSIASITSSLRRLSGKRRSKNKDTHFVNENAVTMKVTPL